MNTTTQNTGTLRTVARATGLAMLSLALMVGCSDKKGTDAGNSQSTGANKEDKHADHEAHAGPHKGQIIELGHTHEYHAELVENDETKLITIYILDGKMKELAIEPTTITMNLMVDGETKSFELTAEGVNDGKASQFNAADESLFEALHVHEAEGKLNVIIGGTPFSGKVEHHDHDDQDDHGHEH